MMSGKHMTPQRKLRISSILMILGIAPWVIILVWVAAIFLLNMHGRPPRVFMLDPIGMIGIMILAFTIAAICGGLSTIWSLSLTRYNPELCSKRFLFFRGAVILAIVGPALLALYFG